jgi:hypothetical protein
MPYYTYTSVSGIEHLRKKNKYGNKAGLTNLEILNYLPLVHFLLGTRLLCTK